MTTGEAYRRAMRHAGAGELGQAADICRELLTADPHDADARHLAGLLAVRQGQVTTAIEQIELAIASRPDEPVFYANLGEVYRQVGRFEDGARCLQRALELNPLFTEAHNNLGTLLLSQKNVPLAIEHLRTAIQLNSEFAAAHENLSSALAMQGNLAEALAGLERVIALKPDHFEAHLKLGALAFQLGQTQRAASAFREAVRLNPRVAKGHNNLGTILCQLGQFRQALPCFRAAIELEPGMAESHFNLGIALHTLGEKQASDEAVRESLRIRPDYLDALTRYGNQLLATGQLDEALEYFDRALVANPQLAIVHFNRGNVFQMKNLPEESAAAYREALRLEPNSVETYNNLALLLGDTGKTDEAVDACRQGLALAPDHSFLHSNLAKVLELQGRLEEAIDYRRKALALAPESAAEHSNLLYSLNMSPTQTSSTIHAEHLVWGARHAEALTAAAAAHPVDRDPARRLRVGYVSPFFRRHAVNYFIEPVLLNHDHQQFEIYCYSDLQAGDDVTDRLQSAADVWRPIAFQPDAEVAAQIRQDQIDILVDLPGHIGGNRLLVFARKPAPIQVTYLGYQNTTGMRAMDYRLTDARADPPGVTDAYYTEQLVRLPRAFFCYQPEDEGLEVSPLPALKRGYLTFGSFNNYIKVTPQTVAAWLEILKRVADSRLLVLAYRDGYVERSLREQAQAAGVDPARIEVVDKRAHRPYMELLGTADIGLDPFPFNGHTTTCDSVWMGVPVVMLEGTSYASRFGGSVLANVGLEDWIASSVEGYIETASYWAGELAQLAHLRGVLRARMASSALLDYAGFTRQLETAYRQMWQTRCTS